MSPWNMIRRRRRHMPSPFLHALHELAQRVDRESAASVTVVLRKSSGSYRDVNFLFGSIVAWLGLILIILSPWEVAEWSLPIDVAVLFALSTWICSRTRLRRWLTSRRRRRHQVHVAARAALIEEGVWQAPRNQGVLVYWSRLEAQLDVLIADGVQAVVPVQDWNKIVHALRQAPRQEHAPKMFLERLKELGALLAVHLPPLPHENDALRMEDAR
jgi:putative membrane protein